MYWSLNFDFFFRNCIDQFDLQIPISASYTPKK